MCGSRKARIDIETLIDQDQPVRNSLAGIDRRFTPPYPHDTIFIHGAPVCQLRFECGYGTTARDRQQPTTGDGETLGCLVILSEQEAEANPPKNRIEILAADKAANNEDIPKLLSGEA